MKRISILLTLVLLLSALAGCGDGSGKVINEPTGNPIKIIGSAVDPTATPEAAPTSSDLPADTATPAPAESATPAPTGEPTPTAEPTATPTITPTPSPSVAPTATPTPNTSKAEQFAAIALAQEGAPHASGGTSIEEDGGFDPGGFVYYCLKQMGEKYRHKSSKGYSEMDEWQRVDDIDDLLVGDLCFFKVSDGEDVNCVCIYLGDGRMIYPSKSEGKVIIVKITSDYWTKAFAWASRVY